MKKRFISFLSGMVVGAVMFGGSVAYASGIPVSYTHLRAHET